MGKSKLLSSDTVLYLITVAAVALSCWFFTDFWTTRTQLKNAQQTIISQQDQLSVTRRSHDAILDALKKEQETAGRMEGARDANWKALMDSEKHRVILESWFNAYRADHGDNRVNWNAYYRGLEK